MAIGEIINCIEGRLSQDVDTLFRSLNAKLVCVWGEVIDACITAVFELTIVVRTT